MPRQKLKWWLEQREKHGVRYQDESWQNLARELHTKPSVKGHIKIKVEQGSQVLIQWTCGLWAHHVG
jgi:hypothetical protein